MIAEKVKATTIKQSDYIGVEMYHGGVRFIPGDLIVDQFGDGVIVTGAAVASLRMTKEQYAHMLAHNTVDLLPPVSELKKEADT